MKFTNSCHEVYCYCHVMKFTIAVVKFTSSCHGASYSCYGAYYSCHDAYYSCHEAYYGDHGAYYNCHDTSIAVVKFTIAEHNPNMRLFTTTNILLLPTLWQDNTKIPIMTTPLTWRQESVGTPPAPRPSQLGMQAMLCCQLHHRVQ